MSQASHDLVAAAYATAAARHDPSRLIGPALRTRSTAIRDVFACLAGAFSYADLVDAVVRSGTPPISAVATPERWRWLAALGRLVAAQNVESQDRAMGLSLLEAVVEHADADALSAEEQVALAQLLFLDGRFQALRATFPALDKLPDVIAHYLRCDLAHPTVDGGASKEAWLTLLNEPFVAAGLEPLHVMDEAATLFDSLTVDVEPGSTAGPLISVIMTTYCPNHSLVTAVSSILRQTWSDLELIIVDDASGPDFDAAFDTCLKLDDRVRVIRQPVNGGTYIARNVGLDKARGEYVAFQDSDDWSHPRRLELQIAAIRNDPSAVASRSQIVRAHPNLTHQWFGYPAQRLNPWSLLIHRESVIGKIGYFDAVRKGADAEYGFRLEAAFGKAMRDLSEPLAYYRLHQASLSRADFALGWSAPARIAHRAAYVQWHREITGGGSAYRSADPSQRPFPAPAAFLERIPGVAVPREHYDVVLLDDWQPKNGPHDVALDELSALNQHGFVAGLAHLEFAGLMTASRKLPARQIQEVVNNGAVDRVLLDQDVSVGTLVIRHPAVLQFPPANPSRLRVDRVIVMARRPSEYGDLAAAYDAATCTANARAMFGVDPWWAVGHGGLASEYGVKLVIPSPVEPSWIYERQPRGSRPVVGWFGAQSDDDVPATGTLRFVPPDSRAWRAMGARYLGRVLHSAANPRLDVRDRGKLSWGEYLSEIDFLLCYPPDSLAVAPLDVTVRAMAAGVVVVVPENYRDLLGDAAVYATSDSVRNTVRRFHRDTDEYRRQAERAGDWVSRHHSYSAYAGAVQQLADTPRVDVAPSQASEATVSD